MLKEALEFLSGQSAKAKEARTVTVDKDGRHVYIDQGGTFAKLPVAPPNRAHALRSVADLIAAAERYGSEGDENNQTAVIWIGEDEIVLLPDDSDRRDRLTLPLVRSNAFRRLCELQDKPVIEQAALVRLLRVDFRGAVNQAEILTAVRRIKFRTGASGESNIQHGNESLGKTIEAEVTGAGNIPELVTVECALFTNPGEEANKFNFGCDLEIVPAEQKFRFRPLPDEITGGLNVALDSIRDRIKAELPDMPLFFGKP